MDGFVECPRTHTLTTLLTCWQCERTFQVDFGRQRVECLDDDGFKSNYVEIMAGKDVE